MSDVPGAFPFADEDTDMLPVGTHGAIPHDTTMVDASVQPSHQHDAPIDHVITSSTPMDMGNTSNAPARSNGRNVIALCSRLTSLQEGHRHEQDNRPLKKQAVTTPQRDQLDNLREQSEQVRQDAKTARREKKEAQKQLQDLYRFARSAANTLQAQRWEQTEAGVEAWKENAKVALNNQLHEQVAEQVAKTKAELTAEAAAAVKKASEEAHEEAQRTAKAGVAAREAELKETIARVNAEKEADKRRLQALEEKRNAEFETKMAAFRTRESTQRRGVGQPNDGGVPDGTPIHRTELVSQATREQRRLETVMREGGNRLPTFTVIAPAVGPSGSGAAPTPDPQHIGQGALPVDQDLIARMIAEAVADAMKKKASPRKKRNVVPGLRAQLDTAKKWQQERMSRADDLSWKVRLSSFGLQFRGLNSQQKFVDVVWRHAQSREKADHFHDYDPAPESLMLRAEAGQLEESDAATMSSKFWFEANWEACVLNSLILDKCVEEIKQRRAEDTNGWHVQDVTDEYIKALFHGHMVQAQLAWKRNQIRAGEGEEEKNDRVAKWTDQRRMRTVATSRKMHKFELRMAGAKRMILRCVAERNDSGISMWTWMVEVVSELGHAGMSSEDDRSVIPTVGRSRRAKTVHIIKICPWRLEKITEYLEYIDEITAETVSKGHSRRDREREEVRSNTLPPLGLPRSLYDAAWLSHTKARVPDIEEQLQISDKEFQIMDIQMEWPQAPGEAMEM
ncbi:hypothetical protein B0H16DRAFT_1468543 [Mycena metata]|uniref:Uncharacterized protein n=1 Tax=Mycena metata TaxID=1033252 RepID=A0AAD7I2G0_9AGAR|nr:hypothetical protein B0H16DRAFT_1468543 [Mycena metata]